MTTGAPTDDFMEAAGPRAGPVGRANIGVRSLLRVVRALGILLGDLILEPPLDEPAAGPSGPFAAAEQVLKRRTDTKRYLIGWRQTVIAQSDGIEVPEQLRRRLVGIRRPR